MAFLPLFSLELYLDVEGRTREQRVERKVRTADLRNQKKVVK